jgi:hypothetical protein
MLDSIAEKRSSKAETTAFVAITILATIELAWCAYLGFHFHNNIPTFAAAFLLVGAAGITVSWYRYLEAYKEGISNKSLSAVATLFITVGLMLEALAYLLKG